jgi:hypothetical protein
MVANEVLLAEMAERGLLVESVDQPGRLERVNWSSGCPCPRSPPGVLGRDDFTENTIIRGILLFLQFRLLLLSRRNAGMSNLSDYNGAKSHQNAMSFVAWHPLCS